MRKRPAATDVLKLTSAELARGYRAFQAHDSRDALYETATFLVEHFWGKPREMANGVGVLLLTWVQAFYRYGSFDFDQLEEALRKNMTALSKLRRRNIDSLTATDEPAIARLFTVFLQALRVKEGKRQGYVSRVATAKALHLLAPCFLPLWDAKIALAYGCPPSRQPVQEYLKFAYCMRTLSRELGPHLPADCQHKFLKLIDEYNFAKYTRGWV